MNEILVLGVKFMVPLGLVGATFFFAWKESFLAKLHRVVLENKVALFKLASVTATPIVFYIVTLRVQVFSLPLFLGLLLLAPFWWGDVVGLAERLRFAYPKHWVAIVFFWFSALLMIADMWFGSRSTTQVLILATSSLAALVAMVIVWYLSFRAFEQKVAVG